MRIFFMPRRARNVTVALLFAGLVSFVAFAQLGGSSGVIIPYSGYLELDGEPVHSPTDMEFRFTLWPSASGGTACASRYSASSDVRGGKFNVEIGPVAESCVLGKEVYLSVEVLGDGVNYTELAGRQRVYPALGAMTSGTGHFDVNDRLTVGGDALIGGDAVIDGEASIDGDAVIGGEASIGTAVIGGNASVGGDASVKRLRVSSGEFAQVDNGSGGIIVGAVSSVNLALDTNDIMARNNGAPEKVFLNRGGGDVELGDASSNIVIDGSLSALKVSGDATGFVRGGGWTVCDGFGNTLYQCGNWGTGRCDANSGAGACGGAPACAKGTVQQTTPALRCYNPVADQWTGSCRHWVCVE